MWAVCSAGGTRSRDFKAIVVAEEADIHGAAVHFIEVNIIGAMVGSRESLEEEDLEIALEQRVAFDEIGQGTAFGTQFILDRADENAWLMLHEFGAQPAVPNNALNVAGEGRGGEVRNSKTGRPGSHCAAR